MRGVGLIIAGCAAAACGGPGVDNSSAAGAEAQEEIAAANKALNEHAEMQPASEALSKGNETLSTGNDVGIEPANPCLMQGADRLQVAPIRAVGTEPFWGARVEGRCVTYSTPDNQRGIRLWTRYSDGGNGRRAWVGQLDGKKFEMRVRPEAGCSDGMSDERYPMAVELMVNGEKRAGCAESL